jgi:hypothetical protein
MPMSEPTPTNGQTTKARYHPKGRESNPFLPWPIKNARKPTAQRAKQIIITPLNLALFRCNAGMGAYQVIMQVWISTRFGVLSKRPPFVDEGDVIIKAVLVLRAGPGKCHFMTLSVIQL